MGFCCRGAVTHLCFRSLSSSTQFCEPAVGTDRGGGEANRRRDRPQTLTESTEGTWIIMCERTGAGRARSRRRSEGKAAGPERNSVEMRPRCADVWFFKRIRKEKSLCIVITIKWVVESRSAAGGRNMNSNTSHKQYIRELSLIFSRRLVET